MAALNYCLTLVVVAICLIVQLSEVSGQVCPSGWIKRKGDPNCYFISPKSKKSTWKKARAYCQKAKGDLLKLDSPQLKTWLYAQISRRIKADKSNTHWWVGLSRANTTLPWKWPDGTAIDKTLSLWRPGEPNDSGNRKENCAEIKVDGQVTGLNDEICAVSYTYICQTRIEIPAYCDTDTIQGWDTINGICYKYMDYLRTWADAKASCEGAGAQLVSPSDTSVQQLVQSYAKQNKRDVWINGISQPIKNKPNYQFVWSNSTTISKAFWAPKQPKVAKGQENSTCVKIPSTASNANNWQADQCDNENQYVCSKVPGGCAPGWTPFSRWCYQFNYQALLSWSQANKYCQKQGAILMEITTKDQQNNFLVPFLDNLQQGGIPSIWIGMSDGPNKAGAFHWTSGAKLGYKNWAKAFPNDTANKLDCGVIYTDDDKGLWSTTPNCLQAKGFLCQANENDVIYPVSTPAPTFTCDDGWDLNGQTCYKFYTKHATWLAAQIACQQNGGRLARVLDGDTQTYINKKVKQDSWIGLNDRRANGQYLFGSDTSATFLNWDNKQPTKRADWNCGIVSGASGHKGKWKIVDCSKSYPYICEKQHTNIPPTVGPTTPAVTWSTNCGPFWDENPLSGYCYKIVNRPLSWKDARDFCRNSDNNGDLASIISLDEQNYISGRLTTNTYLSYWIGGNDLNSEGGWEWADGSGFAFMNWGKGQPDNWKSRQDCLRVDMSQFKAWDDAECWIRYPFVCKKAGKNARPLPTESTNIEPVCGEGWIAYGNTCFEFNQKRANWGQARSTCLREGGDLAIVPDLATQGFINGNIKIESWIGLNDRFKEKTFIWNNDNKTTSIAFKNWASGQPDHKKDQDCVTVQTAANVRGKWRDNKCNGKWGYICQKPATCGKNWYLLGTNCYLFNTSGATWAGARKQCKNMGADLLTIKTQDVQSFITGKLLRESWMGLNDQIKNKKYTWLDSTDKVPFFNWAKGQPDNKDNEDCGTIMKTSGKWRDRSCTEQYGFVCQKSSASLLLGCPDGWVGYEGHCYFVGYKPNIGSWQNARASCQSMSSDLVSITRPQEQKFVFSRSSHAHSPVWIGLNDIDNFAGHRMFSWSDNSPVTFTNWAKGEPNNYGGTENCVAMNRDKKGGWDDYPCSTQDVRAYVCEMEMQPTALTTKNPMKAGCKSGLGLYATCYTFVTSKQSFGNAEKYCVSKLKGHLATITSRYIQAFIASELADREGNWWIGLSNTDPQTYKWTSGQAISYTNWDVSHTGNEAAGAVTITAEKPIGLWRNQKNKGTKLPFVCESARAGGFTTPAPDKPTPNPFANCPTFFVERQGYCYRAFYSSGPSRKTWSQARAYCQRYGGDLVSFHSKDEEDFVKTSVIRKYPGIFWIGINDIQKEKGFKWSDGTPVDYTNWMPHQPDDHKHHEDCGEFNANTNQWNDDNCNLAKSYICKVMKGASPNRNVAMPTLGPIIPCSGHLSLWSFFKGNCYYVSKGRRSFYDSRTFCVQNGGELVSIHDHDESDYVISKISRSTTDSFWIGLNDIGENGYNWTDGSPLNFINWYQNEPNDAYGQQSCVQMIRDGFWQDNNCGYLKRFICKAPNGTTPNTRPPPTTMAPGNCPQGFFGQDSRCYIIKGDAKADQVNWTTALSRCKQMGSGVTLATISNVLEQSFITSHLRSRPYNVWIGLNDQASPNQFVWVDNAKVTYTHWAPGEPNGFRPLSWPFSGLISQKTRNMEDCIEVYSKAPNIGGWNDKSCSALRGYVCQAPRSMSNPVPVTSPAPSYCKPGYTVYGSSCFKVDVTRRTWDDAAQSCRSDGAYLASITSSYEQAYVQSLIRFNPSLAWIGLRQTPETGLYDWADSWPVTYTSWTSGEPTRNGQTCVFIVNNGHWRDSNCSYKLPSICKFNPGTPPPYTTRPPGYCADPSWVMFGDYCYFVEKSNIQSRVFLSWPEAQYLCSRKGMALATIRNKAENDFVQNLIKVGIYQKYSAWIGLSAKQDGGFQWEDSSVVDYVNWGKGEPSNNKTRTSEDCVIIGATTGTWYDKACLYKQRFVCSTLKVIPTRVTPPNVTTTKTTPLPVITQASGNPQTPKPVVTQTPVKPKTNKPLVTLRPRTQPTKKPTRAPVTNTPHRQPITFAPTRKPFTPFPPQTNPPIVTRRPPYVTRSPNYQRFHSGNNNANQGNGISGGGIAGICIALILAAALVTIGVLYYRRRQTSLRLQTTVGFDNALYNKTGDSVDIGGND
ncbi:macrophage mannose receptor 1-like isoform X2 [Liolophura sinensis]|uniref:macrophage mannose receptor 1-like isoform X2 n=1 Tax=Liolophura sinensis TaxID=3198878 RepID=UPI003159399A